MTPASDNHRDSDLPSRGRYLNKKWWDRKAKELRLIGREKQLHALGISSMRQFQRYLSENRGSDNCHPLDRVPHLIVKIAELTNSQQDEFLDWWPSLDANTEKSMYAEANLKQLNLLPEYLRTFADRMGQIVSWSRILPCSWESSDFMRLHHESLFNTQVMNEDALTCNRIVAAYNDYGDTAQGRFETADRKAQISFDVIMHETDLRRIAIPDDIQYFKCTRESRLNTLGKVHDEIVSRSDAMNAHLWLIRPDDQAELESCRIRWHPDKIRWDSFVLVRDNYRTPLFVFWRDMPGVMTQMSLVDTDLAIYDEIIQEAECAATKNQEYALNVLRDIQDNICAQKQTAFPA